MFSIPRTSGIYKITCLVNGKIYIGSAGNLFQRWKDHKRTLRGGYHRNSYLQNAWNKYGESSFEFEVIELVMPWSRIDREQYWLDTLKPYNRKNGFNIAVNATTPAHTPEVKAKISKSHMGIVPNEATRAKMSADRKGRTSPRKGVKLSAETRAKMNSFKKGDKINLGRKHTPEHRAKNALAKSKQYVVVNPNGDEIEIRNLAQFCREHELNKGHMVQVAKGTVTSHKGWKCRLNE